MEQSRMGLLGFLVILGLGGCNLVGVQDSVRCGGAADPDARISRCTALLQSSFVTGRRVSVAYVNRGEAYESKGQHDLAIQDFDQAIKNEPDFPDAYYYRGVSYSAEGRYELAIQDFDKTI